MRRNPWVSNLGLSLLLVCIVCTWFRAPPADLRYGCAYGVLALLTCSLAAVALLRPAARSSDERWWVYLVCLVSIAYPFLYRFENFQIIFWCRVAAQCVANVALLSLGRSYGMLPALREVRTGLFYRLVRHPVYAFYMFADLLVVALEPSLRNAAVAALGGAAFLLRAQLEEHVLRDDPEYSRYMRLVPWRFFPWVY